MVLIPDEPTQRERDQRNERASGNGRSSKKTNRPGPDKNRGKDSGRSNRPKPHDDAVPR
jgi:hypothetical protein